MANSRIYFKSEAGGTTVVSRDTTATSGNLVLPASGNVASVDTAVTDNAIARFDGTTGKLQNSAITIDDTGNIGTGTQSFNGFGGSGFKNYIINGKFEVWQRGTSFTLTPGLTLITADRFRVYNGTNQNLIVEKGIVSSTSSKAYSRMRLSFLTAPTTGSVTISQRIEDVTRISGGNFVSSCFIATNENMVINQSITHNFGTGGSASTTYSGTPNVSTIGGYIMSKYTLPYVNSQTIGVSNYAELTYDLPFRSLNAISFTNVQLEEGSVATPFEQRPIGLELSLCQRYYEEIDVYWKWDGSLGGSATTSVWIKYSQIKRVSPTVTVRASANTNMTQGAISSNTYGFKSELSFNNGGTIESRNLSTIYTASAEL